MKVLVACERSGRVRDAFIARGHDAMSCDIEPTDVDGPHHQGDVTPLLRHRWDLVIAHPPCTYLAGSGARWWKDRLSEQSAALEFFAACYQANAPRVCVENPVGVVSRLLKPTQYIQPWQYGHGETKKTGLWLIGLPPLVATLIATGREARIHRMPPGPDRAKNRSVTYAGIAQAMGEQWGTE